MCTGGTQKINVTAALYQSEAYGSGPWVRDPGSGRLVREPGQADWIGTWVRLPWSGTLVRITG